MRVSRWRSAGHAARRTAPTAGRRPGSAAAASPPAPATCQRRPPGPWRGCRYGRCWHRCSRSGPGSARPACRPDPDGTAPWMGRSCTSGKPRGRRRHSGSGRRAGVRARRTVATMPPKRWCSCAAELISRRPGTSRPTSASVGPAISDGSGQSCASSLARHASCGAPLAFWLLLCTKQEDTPR